MSTIPDTMLAVVVEGGKGPTEALRTDHIPTPAIEPGDILIRVHAAGVNRPDVIQRLGFYPPPPGAPVTLGLEVAGDVVAVGADAGRWKTGDQVCALLGGGGYAQFCRVDARHALPIPHGLTLLQAAALPETAFTVYANVFEGGGLKAGETLMVHGATSGIGVMAIQMAKACGARVVATSRGAGKAAEALKLGADVSVDVGTDDFVEVTKTFGGVDVILDMVGGDYAARNLTCLKPQGRLVMVATQAGAEATIDLSRIMVRRLTITGSTLRPRSAVEKARLAGAVEAHVWPWISTGKIVPIIDRAFPLGKAADAHAYLEQGHHVGKVMLEL